MMIKAVLLQCKQMRFIDNSIYLNNMKIYQNHIYCITECSNILTSIMPVTSMIIPG